MTQVKKQGKVHRSLETALYNSDRRRRTADRDPFSGMAVGRRRVTTKATATFSIGGCRNKSPFK